MNNKFLKFPDNFLWGASTSAYQVEGGIENCDWTKAYPAGKACDHYNRYEEDFDLAKSLNQNAHRFSIEWSRIEPEEGKFDQKEIEHYREVLKALKSRNIKIIITLHHYTNPLWLMKIGGWTNKKTIFYFSRFAEKIFKEYKDLVNFWITINEPLVYASHGYLIGIWPPQEKSLLKTIKVIRNLIEAHKKAYKIIHKIDKNAQVGIAKHNTYFEPYQNKLINRILASWNPFSSNYFWNEYFLNRIKNCQDFIGLNHYRTFTIKFNWKSPKNWIKEKETKLISDMGWAIYPKGIYYVLKDLKKYQKPIYITESGLADAEDKNRSWYIREILKNVHRAIQEGADVKGYLYWSLLDNFEWDKEFGPRFGLIEMDYQNLERKIRQSAFEYAKIIKNNGLYINE